MRIDRLGVGWGRRAEPLGRLLVRNSLGKLAWHEDSSALSFPFGLGGVFDEPAFGGGHEFD